MHNSAGDALAFWEGNFKSREQRALGAARLVTDETLDRSDPETIVTAIVADYAAQPVRADFDALSMNTRDESMPLSSEAGESSSDILVELVLPVSGAGSVVMMVEPKVVSSSGGQGGDRGFYRLKYVVVLRLSDEVDTEQFVREMAAMRAWWMTEVSKAIDDANQEINAQLVKLRDAVMPIVRRRHLQRRLVTTAAAAMDIPLNPGRESPITMPLQPKSLTLASVEGAARTGGSEAGLLTDIADTLIATISSFSLALERSRGTAQKLLGNDEETLRDVLLFILNANWEGTVTGETFVGDGKTDIHLGWRNRDAFIGECKIWRGQKALSEGLHQLLDRYTVWRATRVALILFIRSENPTDVIAKAESVIREDDRFLTDAPVIAGRSAFLMKAQHDAQQVVSLALIPVVLAPN